jgi:hypothetical protein
MSPSSRVPPEDQIAISIGGSGARCAEPLIYLCAAGVIRGKLTLAFVDADTNNHSLQRVVELANIYRRLQPPDAAQAAACPFLSANLELAEPNIWSPFRDGLAKPSLKHYFDHATLSARPETKDSANLMEAMYTHEQREASLDVGFRGKPSIGAAIFSESLRADEPPWRRLIAGLTTAAGGGTPKIFALGSFFGGTGAAGIPTIPRLLRDSVSVGRENIVLGAAPLLPYFTFHVPASVSEVYAAPEFFVMNSKEALRYYHSSHQFHRIYLFGTDRQARQPEFGLGGQDQKNLPHYIELLGAVAAADFFANAGTDNREVVFAGVESAERFEWQDVPDQGKVQPALGNLARLCFFYLTSIHPRLQAIKETGGAVERTPWRHHLLVRRGVRLEDADTWRFFEDMKKFAQRYLKWLRDLQANSGEVGVKLANAVSFPSPEKDPPGLSVEQFDGDLLFEGKGARIDLARMWARLCEQESIVRRKVEARRAFQTALYEAVRK